MLAERGDPSNNLPSSPTTIPGVTDPLLTNIDARLRNSNDNSFDLSEDQGISAELNWDLGETSLTVIGSFRNFVNTQVADADFTQFDLLIREQTYDQDEFTLEIRLNSNGGETFDWTVGTYLYSSDLEFVSPAFPGDDLRPALGPDIGGLLTLFEVGQVALGGNVPIDQIGNFYLAPGGLDISADARNKTDSYAFFGQATWHASDDLSLTLGLRYSKEEKDVDHLPRIFNPFAELTRTELARSFVSAAVFGQAPGSDPVANGAAVDAFLASPGGMGLLADPTISGTLDVVQQSLQTFFVPFAPFSAPYEDDNVSGTVSVNYDINDDVSIYARYARGYKGGGLNLDRGAAQAVPGVNVGDPNALVFEPEIVDSFETGIKSRLFDNSVTLNASVYYQELDNLQFQFFSNGTQLIVRNAAEVEATGLEVDLAWAPTDRWLISGGFVWQDITYGKFLDGPANTQARLAGMIDGSTDISGQDVANAPEISVSLLIGYHQSISDSVEFSASLNGVYRSDQFTDVSNDPSGENTLKQLNLVIAIGSIEGSWALEVWGKNLTDETFYRGGLGQAFLGPESTLYFGAEPPRTFGLTAKYNF